MLDGTRALELRWASPSDDPQALVGFFVGNVSPDYISQGEIQDGRASVAGVWSSNLHSILLRQFGAACRRLPEGNYDETRIALANDQAKQLTALGYVGIDRSSSIASATLYDLLVRTDARGSGAGSDVLEWIERQLHAEKIKFLFLETAMRNRRAQAFFEHAGFVAVSVNCMKEL